MNERIGKLAEQAGLLGPSSRIGNSHDAAERFAQLIVQECLNKISGLIVPETFEQDIGPYEKWNQALGHAALEIEQHFFGVEE